MTKEMFVSQTLQDAEMGRNDMHALKVWMERCVDKMSRQYIYAEGHYNPHIKANEVRKAFLLYLEAVQRVAHQASDVNKLLRGMGLPPLPEEHDFLDQLEILVAAIRLLQEGLPEYYWEGPPTVEDLYRH